MNRTTPDGRVIGIDLIPAQPPRGVSTIQGNFLSPVIQDEVRAYVRDPDLGRPRKLITSKKGEGLTQEEVDEMERGYIDIERQAHLDGVEIESIGQPGEHTSQETTSDVKLSLKERDIRQGRAVDVVLSDMSEPWDQTAGFYKKSLSDPYFRMMNTSGNAFRDHAGSMVGNQSSRLQTSLTRVGSLYGCVDVLFRHLEDRRTLSLQVLPRDGGKGVRDQVEAPVHQGTSGEARLVTQCMIPVVLGMSDTDFCQESKEAYFVALRRKETPTRGEVFRE